MLCNGDFIPYPCRSHELRQKLIGVTVSNAQDLYIPRYWAPGWLTNNLNFFSLRRHAAQKLIGVTVSKRPGPLQLQRGLPFWDLAL